MAKKVQKDPYKSSDDLLIEKRWEEKYKLQVQDLMDLIPESHVLKQVDELKEEGVVLSRSVKWTVGDRVVYSGFYDVRSIEANDEELHMFYLKAKDYKKFARACEQRRAELLKAHKKDKQK